MSDHFQNIYAQHADEYHRMIAAEDRDHQILATLQELGVLPCRRMLDLGAGTGRLPLLLQAARYLPAHLTALDLSAAMLHQQQIQRHQTGGDWTIVQGDLRALPFPDGWADLTTAGWAIGHLRAWFAADWQAQIGAALTEMRRVTTPVGNVLIFETLGTGSLVPAPPTPELADYYTWLEGTWGFQRHELQTDYQFDSVADAVQATEFFFGPELADMICRQNWSRLPEWTGCWVWHAG